MLKKEIETRVLPKNIYTWKDTCRLYDPNTLWEIDGRPASCYRPTRKEWTLVYWKKKLPSIVPPRFWNYFMRMMKSFITMSGISKWSHFEPAPIILYPHKKWDIGMRVEIVGDSVHNEENYPDELRFIDEFISVGISIQKTKYIHENIHGLNPYSIGWHSDDGAIYMDSLLLYECEKYGKGDQVEIKVDYISGMILFRKNGRIVAIHELSGDFLCSPLIFGVSCTTSNSLFLTIV